MRDRNRPPLRRRRPRTTERQVRNAYWAGYRDAVDDLSDDDWLRRAGGDSDAQA